MNHEPQHPGYEQQVRESFARQGLMQTLGAQVSLVQPGAVDIAMPLTPGISQQNGFAHAGAISAIADSSCGYAAYSLAAANWDVLTVEFKVNLLSPARGERFVAQGRVLKHGRTLTICESKVIAELGGKQTLVAAMMATIILRPIPA